MKDLVAFLTCIGIASSAVHAQTPAKSTIEQEATIKFAANGGIRSFQVADQATVYLQDRRLAWYRVDLSSPCLRAGDNGALYIETDVNGTFDTFSQIRSSKYPEIRCGIDRIVTSSPPSGQPGTPDDGDG
ncbi:DUF6491 family protein [Sphingomonas gilva]|uniref:DUF6491 family protein n=1 Tax=Sphingomonas gilva TaxID=2305907 RepID=UPI0011C3CAE3|nr:DUF6491 family protein [Sphingomonas gilva]